MIWWMVGCHWSVAINDELRLSCAKRKPFTCLIFFGKLSPPSCRPGTNGFVTTMGLGTATGLGTGTGWTAIGCTVTGSTQELQAAIMVT